MFAIVDIETTGGYAANNGITEIAIVLHDGKKVIRRFETLVNPLQPIPRFIQSLTGITDSMIAEAPTFEEVAAEIFECLKDTIFLAHNVNFDYSFLKYHLATCGYDLNVKKLCTVRLSRKVFPGLPGYGLGKLCRQLGIPMINRHRAGGDADATTILFEKILEADSRGHLQSMLKGRSSEQYLPPNLPAEALDRLPFLPGVYYFHDLKGKIIYVGKAKNLRSRVRGHFSNNKPNRQKQEFLRNIYSVTWQETGSELMAYLFECVEIKRLWPKYNRSLKRFEQAYGIYMFEDQQGYWRLGVEKLRKNMPALYTFSLLTEGHQLLRRLVHQYNLCPKRCFLQRESGPCEGSRTGLCQGACEIPETVEQYNSRVDQAIEFLEGQLPSFALADRGRNGAEQSYILIEAGRFYGMGFVENEFSISTIEDLKNRLTRYPENDYMRGLVYQYAIRCPQKKISFSSAFSSDPQGQASYQ